MTEQIIFEDSFDTAQPEWLLKNAYLTWFHFSALVIGKVDKEGEALLNLSARKHKESRIKIKLKYRLDINVDANVFVSFDGTSWDFLTKLSPNSQYIGYPPWEAGEWEMETTGPVNYISIRATGSMSTDAIVLDSVHIYEIGDGEITPSPGGVSWLGIGVGVTIIIVLIISLYFILRKR